MELAQWCRRTCCAATTRTEFSRLRMRAGPSIVPRRSRLEVIFVISALP